MISDKTVFKRITKEKLGPLGFIQKGNSRTLFHDNGWYITIIEFQPSSFSKGSYLNIGIDFNFFPRDHFAFEVGYREHGFKESFDQTDFEKTINEFCEIAEKKVKEIESHFTDFSKALNRIKEEKTTDSWKYFIIAILYGLIGNLDLAKVNLLNVIVEKCKYDWQFKRKEISERIISWLSDQDTFLVNLRLLVQDTRKLKKLPDFDLEKIIK